MNKYTLKFNSLLIILPLLFSMAMAANAKSKIVDSPMDEVKKDYLLGIFPYLAPRELEKMYAPIAADFSGVAEKNVLFMTSSTYKNFMVNLDKQMYDIVFVQPFDYVNIADKYGYRPLATRNKPLPAILVVKPDGKINNVAQLRGKVIALPPAVAAISYLIKNYLKENGLNPGTDVKIEHQRSHASCMRSVMLGTAAACGTAPPALAFFTKKMNTQLNTIAKTKAIPNSLFAVHPNVPEQVYQELLKQISSWSTTESGKLLLKGSKVDKFIPAYDKDYNVVRRMAKEFRHD